MTGKLSNEAQAAYMAGHESGYMLGQVHAASGMHMYKRQECLDDAKDYADMMTVCVQIGNSDDKLSQEQWCNMMMDVRRAVFNCADKEHSQTYSKPESYDQSACHIFDIDPAYIDGLRDALEDIRQRYNQDAIAWSVMHHDFIGQPPVT